ncbi:MAG: DUF1592 domain-containing protein [Bryobacteraceae bacterium]|nr:DUF1592 domain-containing protein [Bryobacteraceae bacterium]
MRFLCSLVLLSFLLLLPARGQLAPAKKATPVPSPFTATVKPVLQTNCSMCHNAKLASGGLSLDNLDATTLETQRIAWERIVAKLKSGEMPPKGAPQPVPDKRTSVVEFLEKSFDAADRSRPPDAGRVLARRLNRAEYANTIRDVLGVRIKAEEELPADDSILGFDNIGEVLTVSPLLMQKYVYTAEKVASLAIGADPLPKPAVVEYKAEKVRRLDLGATEHTDHLDYSADYLVRVWVRGHLGPNGAPVSLRLLVDGQPVRTMDVPTKENETATVARDAQRSHHEARVYLEAGPHSFRAELVGDEFRKPVPPPPAPGGNQSAQQPLLIYPEKFDMQGPFPPAGGARASRSRILTCDPATGGPACVRQIMTPLARRAYRRPVTSAEVDKLVAIAGKATAAGFKPDQAVQFAIQAMLVQPAFLFRIERDPKGRMAPISDIELASRLSYFLWSSAPDEELLSLAEGNKLRKPGVLEGQVTRMLADPKSIALAENFAGQWLETRSLAAVKPDPVRFPMWNAALADDLQAETKLFFDSLLRENKPVSEFLTADYTFLNARLARHYGIKGVTGPDFQRIPVDPAQRGGILSHGSILTLTSYPARTSPVLRGKYIMDVILGSPPPPPPADVPALDESKATSPASLREALSLHRSDAVCASCHSKMDPLGFGLENYDPIGRWRIADGKTPIEAGGTLPNGVTFTTPAELRALLLKDLPEFTRNLTEKMLTYALGRGLERFDRPAIRDITSKMEKSEYRFQVLVREIVTSLPFQNRRGQLADTQATAAITRDTK